MESLCTIIRPRFKRHWREIACQINAVIDIENPKRGFLFDCGAANENILVQLVANLRAENVVGEEIKIVVVKEDFFILNVRKFRDIKSHMIVDVSGSLKKPKVVEDLTAIHAMFASIKEQLEGFGDLVTLKVSDDWCVATIFGFLINYPVLYFHQPDVDSNCLSLVDLTVHQVTTGDQLLVSFSIPTEIFEQHSDVRNAIDSYLKSFSNTLQIKSFTANYPVVIL